MYDWMRVDLPDACGPTKRREASRAAGCCCCEAEAEAEAGLVSLSAMICDQMSLVEVTVAAAGRVDAREATAAAIFHCFGGPGNDDASR